NQYVARVLHEARLGTLLFDLLTADEEHAERFTRHLRFDIDLIALRLATATRWLIREGRPGNPRIGYFGSSTGAAAALVAAARFRLVRRSSLARARDIRMITPFQDRFDAGRQLGARLSSYAKRGDVVVLALPRGGVPVGYEVARQLNAPLDIFLVRKLGVPGREELAMGAIASGGVRVVNEDVMRELGIAPKWLDIAAADEMPEMRRREQAY